MRFRRNLIIFLLVFMMAATVSARQFLQAENCTIEEDEAVVGTLVVVCQNLTINGTLDGNLLGAATNTVVNGEITDGVYLLGGQFDLFGSLGDDLHYVGMVLNVHNEADFESDVADIFSLTLSTRLEPESSLPGSVIAAGYQMLLEGDVSGEVNFWGSALELGGQIGGDVTTDVGNAEDTEAITQLETLFLPFPFEIELVNPGLRISSNSEINGNLRYRSPAIGVIDGTIEGSIYFDEIIRQPQIDINDEESLRQGVQQYMGVTLREFATLAVVGVAGLLFAPGLTQAPIRNLRRRPLTSLGVGTLTFILSFPVVVIAVVISLLLIFMLTLLQAGNLIIAGTVILVLLDVGGASLFYFVAIFVARSIVCLAFGRRVLRTVIEDDGTTRFLILSLGVGSFIIAILVSLPYIGWILNAITLFLGLGAIVNLVQAQLRTIRENVAYTGEGVAIPSVRLGSRRIDIERPALPAGSQSVDRSKYPRPQHDVGLDDLPPGFVWWDEL